MKSSGRGSRRNTAIRFLTWKDMAERRNEVMDMVAQVVSWAKAGGTNRFVRLPMSLIINIKYYINVIIHNDNVNKLVYVRKVGPII